MEGSWSRIYVDREVIDHPRTRILLDSIPHEELVAISGEKHPGGGLLITFNRGSFLKPCPGQKGSVCCGYHVIEWGLGCSLGCEYCVLQTYLPGSDMKVYVNWEKCWDELHTLRKKAVGPLRIGTGQFSDPLILEDVFPFNSELAHQIGELDDVYIEIKTKTDQISPLLNLPNRDRIILAFSLTPEVVSENWEASTASIERRIRAAQIAQDRGFSLAFHFDPIIPVPGWKEEYSRLITKLRCSVIPEKVRWISLGTFRFPPVFPRFFKRHHREEGLFAEECYPSFDGKLRYFRPFREEVYRFFWNRLGAAFPETIIYFCMEASYVWERVTGLNVNSRQLGEMLDGVL